MNIKQFIKNNIFGFIICAIVFGSITFVMATNIDSETVPFITGRNANVENIADALDDLYLQSASLVRSPIVCYNGTCGRLSYKYWNNNFAGSTGANLFDSTHMPATTYASRAALETAYGASNFADEPVYIRSVLIDGNVVGHEACLWNNNKEFCISPNYWAGTIGTQNSTVGTNTKIKLQRDMQNALGLESSNISCGSLGTYADCHVGDFYGRAYSSGYVDCYSSVTVSIRSCDVKADGSAYCYHL